MIINKYKFEFEGEYIKGFTLTLDDNFDFEGQMALYPDACKGYTKFINGEFIEDLEKKKSMEDVKVIIDTIESLKQQLTNTDYKIIKCSEYQLAGLEMPYDIALLHKTRQELRDKINELEN